jgi:hypothetical protein
MDAKTAIAPAPKRVWIIALLALTPFPVAAFTYAYGPHDISLEGLWVLLTWSCVVLAFLGGVRWGLESARPEPRAATLAASVVSPVVSWVLLLARDELVASFVLCGLLIAFMIQWLFDHATPDSASRYPSLSTVLTLGACLSLAVALEHALRM